MLGKAWAGEHQAFRSVRGRLAQEDYVTPLKEKLACVIINLHSSAHVIDIFIVLVLVGISI